MYLLIFSSAILAAGLGPLGALLQTEQFGMTKQQMGYNVAVGGGMGRTHGNEATFPRLASNSLNRTIPWRRLSAANRRSLPFRVAS